MPPGRTSPNSPHGQGQSAGEPKTGAAGALVHRAGPGQRRETALGLKGTRRSPPTPGAPHPGACSTCGGKGQLVDTWNHSASGRSLPDGTLGSIPTWIRQVLVVLVEAGTPGPQLQGYTDLGVEGGHLPTQMPALPSHCTASKPAAGAPGHAPRLSCSSFRTAEGTASPSLSSSTESPPHKDRAAATLWVQWTAAGFPTCLRALQSCGTELFSHSRAGIPHSWRLSLYQQSHAHSPPQTQNACERLREIRKGPGGHVPVRGTDTPGG